MKKKRDKIRIEAEPTPFPSGRERDVIEIRGSKRFTRQVVSSLVPFLKSDTEDVELYVDEESLADGRKKTMVGLKNIPVSDMVFGIVEKNI